MRTMPTKRHPGDLDAALPKGPLADGEHFLNRSPKGDSLYAVSSGGDIVEWLVKDASDTLLPTELTVRKAPAKGKKCQVSVCITYPDGHQHCWWYTVDCGKIVVIVKK